MKKFALLGAVAALATAGGVFAAWTFTENNVTAPGAFEVTVIDIDDDVDYSGTGTLTVKAGSTMGVTVTGVANENANTFTATLSGTITVVYTPASTADMDDNDVEVTATLNGGTTTTATGLDATLSISEKAVTKTTNIAADELELTFAASEFGTFTCNGQINTYAEYGLFVSAVQTLIDSLSISFAAQVA